MGNTRRLFGSQADSSGINDTQFLLCYFLFYFHGFPDVSYLAFYIGTRVLDSESGYFLNSC